MTNFNTILRRRIFKKVLGEKIEYKKPEDHSTGFL